MDNKKVVGYIDDLFCYAAAPAYQMSAELHLLSFDLMKQVKEHRDEINAGGEPGGLIGPADGGIAEARNEDRCDEDTGDHLECAADDGECTEAEALDRVARDVEDGEHPVEDTERTHIPGSCVNDRDIGRIDEEAAEEVSAEVHDHTGDDAVADRKCKRHANALLHTVHLMRAHVLTDEGRHRRGHGVKRAEHQLLHLRAGGETGDVDGAEAVVRGLHDHRADRSDRVLEAHRHAHDDEVPGHGAVPPAVLARRMQHRHHADDVDEAGDAAQGLRGDRRKRGAGAAEVEHGDAEQIQEYIQEGRDREEDEGCLRVPDRAEQTRQQVIEERERDAEEDDQQVLVRVLVDVVRRLHDVHDERAQECGQCRQHHGDDGGHHEAVVHVAPESLHILCAEALGHRDAEVGAAAHAETEDEKLDARAGADRGQRIRAEETPDDHRIDDVVELLEEIPEKKRNHKNENQTERGTRRHTLNITLTHKLPDFLML